MLDINNVDQCEHYGKIPLASMNFDPNGEHIGEHYL